MLRWLICCLLFSITLYAEEGAKPPPGELRVVVLPDKSKAAIGEVVTYHTKVIGGTPPFRYYWLIDGAHSWHPLKNESRTAFYKIPMPNAGNVSLKAIVRDANGHLSNQFTTTVQVLSQRGDLPNNGPWGWFHTTYGDYFLSYNPSTRKIEGKLKGKDGKIIAIWNPELEPHQNKYVEGKWRIPKADNKQSSGAFYWEFDDDWNSFSGAWKSDKDTEWKGGWSGTRFEG